MSLLNSSEPFSCSFIHSQEVNLSFYPNVKSFTFAEQPSNGFFGIKHFISNLNSEKRSTPFSLSSWSCSKGMYLLRSFRKLKEAFWEFPWIALTNATFLNEASLYVEVILELVSGSENNKCLALRESLHNKTSLL